MGKIEQFNTHHIVPKSRGGSNNQENLLVMDVRQHDALHCLFDVNLPDEQIKKILAMYDSVWVKKFRKDIFEVLLDNENKYYINEVRKK